MWTSVPSKPASLDSSARAGPPVHDLGDVLVLHRLRRLAVGRGLHRGWAPEDAEVVGGVARRVDAEVVELGEDGRTVLVHGGRHHLVDLHSALDVLVGEARHSGGGGGVDEPVAGDEEPGAAFGPSGLVGDVALGVVAVGREELDVCRLHDAVAHRDRPDLQRAEEGRVAAHARPPCSLDGQEPTRARAHASRPFGAPPP